MKTKLYSIRENLLVLTNQEILGTFISRAKFIRLFYKKGAGYACIDVHRSTLRRLLRDSW